MKLISIASSLTLLLSVPLFLSKLGDIPWRYVHSTYVAYPQHSRGYRKFGNKHKVRNNPKELISIFTQAMGRLYFLVITSIALGLVLSTALKYTDAKEPGKHDYG